MTNRLVVDLVADGTVGVMVLNGELPSSAPATELSWPLDGDALEDLRWYLEDYLTAPFGVYEDRGGRIAADMDGWGRKLFSSVFGSGPARDAYIGMRTSGDVELVFRSDSSPLLGLPWELMADPGRDTPLALDLAAVSRSLLMSPDAAQAVPVPDGRLRVLLDEADDWCHKSLTISEDLGHRPFMANTYGQLGLLAEVRTLPTLALEWFLRAVTLFDEFPSPLTRRMADYLARLTRQLGIPALREAWRNVTGPDVPQAVLDYVAAYSDEDQPGG